jgi:hypothetical protein
MTMLYWRKMRRLFQFMSDMDLMMVLLPASHLTKDNVPVWHSRRLVESVMERGGNITSICIAAELILDMMKFLAPDTGLMG